MSALSTSVRPSSYLRLLLPQTGQQQNGSGPRGQGQNNRGGYQNNGSRPNNNYNNNAGAGKYQQQQSWGRQGGGWGGPRYGYEASGANGTPLGTPVRMSPVTAIAAEDESPRPAAKANGKEGSANGVKPAGKEEAKAEEKSTEGGKKDKKDKKDKKRKSVGGDETAAPEVCVAFAENAL